jgi:archaellin
MGKNPFPSIFYVYGNKTYEEEIKAYLTAHFNTTPLNLSSSTGCGFKIESYDVGDLKNLDIFLETVEGWIQQTRRTDFNDLETDLLDLDKYLAGCNNRISTNDYNTINFILNVHKSTIAIRTINFIGSPVAGSYIINMGNVPIHGTVPVNASVTDNRILKKTLSSSESFTLAFTNCTLGGVLADYKGLDNSADWTCSNPLPTNTPIPKATDKSLLTYERLPYDNYPRLVINQPEARYIKKFACCFQITGSSGDTYKYKKDSVFPYCYAFNANTGEKWSFEDQLTNDAMNENQMCNFTVDINQNVTQLRFALDSVEHPYPSAPTPVPAFDIWEIVVKTE